METLDGGEDVLELPGPLTADPELTEGVVPERLAERGQRLRQDLFAMSDEHQARTRQLLTQPRVVDRRHHGLARARRRHEQVPVVPPLLGTSICSSSRSWNGSSRSSIGLNVILGERSPWASVRARNSSSYGTKSPLFQ